MLQRGIRRLASSRARPRLDLPRTGSVMGFASSLQHHEAHIWHVNLDDAIWDGFSAVLCENEREKAQRYRTMALQKRYARCRSALRLILGRYSNLAAADLHFCYGEFGKPELIDHRLHFNVSHSGGQALIAVSLHQIGIDLELTGKADVDLPGLIDLVCHPEEKALLTGLPDLEKSTLFYRLWTQKEAYCKMRGIGLQQSLVALHFKPAANPTVFQVCAESDDRAPPCFVHDLHVLDDYAVSVCLAAVDARIVMFQA